MNGYVKKIIKNINKLKIYVVLDDGKTLEIVNEIIDSQKKSRIKFEIDEEYIQKAIWVKTVMGEI